MNRSRIAFTIVALAAIFFLTVSPAAQALPMRGKPSVSEPGGSWIDAAMAWVGRLLTGREDATRTMEKTKPVSGGGVSLPPGTVTPYTGACIDPNGCTWGG